jgi:galactosamine-6-phosphate isomerase
MLPLKVLADHEAVSQHAAALLEERLREEPAGLLCLATGSTPMRTYQLLAERRKQVPRLFDKMRVVNLDEWTGLPADDPATCGRHLRDALVTPLGLGDRYVAFESQPPDAVADCARVAEWLEQNGPIDTCLLGLGLNGHLGFNEPADFLRPHAHVAQLSEASLSHAMIGQCGTRPTGGTTLGMADLMHARQIVLLVTGPTKREILRQVLSGRITTMMPASLLQLHPNVLLLCDRAAYPDAG